MIPFLRAAIRLLHRFSCLVALLTATFLFSPQASSQTWTFRNGFGQPGTTTGLADVGRAVCTDASGNVYITGKISDDLVVGTTVSFGGVPLASAGDDDGFVAKFNSSGVHQWSLRFGGTSIDIGNGIATDGTSVFVTGSANGPMTVGTSATSYPVASAGIDGVIMKLNAATGSVAWVTRFGGGNSDDGQAICLDPSGNVYVSGIFRTRVANPTATFGSFSRTVQGNVAGTYTSDLFVAQLNPTTGVFNWVSTGGIAGGNDNISGSGICYVPSLSEVLVTGSFRWAATGTTTATYSTTTPPSTVTLTNSSATVNQDFCLLEVAASTGAFVSGSGVGSGDGNELGLGITYDSSTGDVFFAGSFSSASVTFPGLAALTNASSTRDNIMYGRYNPTTDAYVWVKDVDNGTPGAAADVGWSIASSGNGSVFVGGNFRNTVTFSGGAALTASGAQSDVFVARINAANGNTIHVTQGTGTNGAADDIAYGIASAPGNNVWGTGQYATSITFSPLAPLASSGDKEDIFLAKLNDPPIQPMATNLSAAESYTEDVTLNLINIVASDVDSANVTATLTLSNPAAGSLTTATSGTVTSTYVAGTGVWTASGAIANVNTLLAGVSFVPAANFNANFTIATSVSDGLAAPITGNKVMTGTAVNDPPNIAGQLPVSTPFNTGRTIVFSDLTVTDVDNSYPTGFTLTTSNGANYTRSGNAITPALNFFGTLTVPTKVNDGGLDSNTFALSMTVNPSPAAVTNAARIQANGVGGYQVTFIGNPGQQYTVQYADVLASPTINWQFLSFQTADANGNFFIIDTPPGGITKRFYRAIFP